MSRFVLCNCPAGFAADPERHAPDCPGRSGAGKPSLLPPGKPFALIGAGPSRAPRPGREYWDRLNSLPRYMFLLRPSGSGVQKLEDPTGNWIDAHEAQKVVEAAQDDLNGLRAELYLAQAREAALTARLEQKITEIIDEATKAIDAYRKEAALQERLNIADQRVDELEAEVARSGAAASPAAKAIITERGRQIAIEGHKPDRDDCYSFGELAMAAAAYAASAGGGRAVARKLFRWDDIHWKPSTPRRDLVKAGALILAEIERIDRALLPFPK